MSELMKNIKRILYIAAIGIMLVAQLLHPASVFADGEGTPSPASTPAVTETPQPTETVVETALPSGTPEITVTPEEAILPTDLPDVTSTTDPNQPTTEPVVATPVSTEFATPDAGELTVEPVVTTPTPILISTEEVDREKIFPTDTNTPTAEPVVSEDDSTVEEPSLGEVLNEIPAETEVVVLDESGQPEPLATVEAAEAISSGDPIWCPEGVTPGDPSCSTSFSNLAELVAGFVPTGNGTIWVSAGNDSSTSAIVIDGNGSWASASNYSLAIQGGWNGITNSVFSVPISIKNWNNAITIENITLSNVTATQGNGISISNVHASFPVYAVNLKNVTVENVTVTKGSGIWIQTPGDLVNLENITVKNVPATQGSGISIEGLDVLLNNITIEKTKGTGLIVNAPAGFIDATNISSNDNQGDGAQLVASFVNLSGANEFNNNQANGASLGAFSDITLNGTNEFNENQGSGLIATGFGYAEFNNVTANNNGGSGLLMYVFPEIVINNVTASNNSAAGISISNADNISLNSVTITSNAVGLYVKCFKSVNFNEPLTNISGNSIQNISIDPSCLVPTVTTTPPVIISPGEIDLDCSKQAAYPVRLPNGDLVSIFCPVSGTASIYRFDNTNLPENLPEGYTYASAFTLDIKQKGVAIPVISEGGYVRSSFVAQPLQPGNTYTVLYWDPWINENGDLINNPTGGSWVPLKDFLLDGDGNVESFDLFPGTDDPRKIISGVNLVSQSKGDRVEVSTNFPGIFVLAQH
jgi:hypothetical protein